MVWQWGPRQEQAFQDKKVLLCCDTVLAYYSLHVPVAVACDSSDIGCGAVLYLIVGEGELKPVMYVSKALTESRKSGILLRKNSTRLFLL